MTTPIDAQMPKTVVLHRDKDGTFDLQHEGAAKLYTVAMRNSPLSQAIDHYAQAHAAQRTAELEAALQALYSAYCSQMKSEYDFPGSPWTPDRDNDKAALLARAALSQPIFHSRQYGDVTEAEMTQYMATGAIAKAEPTAQPVADTWENTSVELTAISYEMDVIHECYSGKENRAEREELLNPLRKKCIAIGERIGALLKTTPTAKVEPTAQLATERNFCERCGQRLGDDTYIHTCTPPVDATYDSLINSVKMQPALQPLTEKTMTDAFEVFASGFDTFGNAWQDMGADEYFKAGFKAAHIKAKDAP